MKANRAALQADEEGISPVLGTLLAVAITVLLGGTVFVVATQFNGPKDNAPSMQFLIDNRSGQIQILRAEKGIDVSTLQVQLSVPGHMGYNNAATLAATTIGPSTWVSLLPAPGTSVTGGDAINFCADAGGGGITVTLRNTPVNQILYQNSFTTLATCG
jgi:flagellin-like protein